MGIFMRSPYVKALKFTLAENSTVKRWQVVATIVGTYFVAPLFALLSPFGILGLAAGLLVLAIGHYNVVPKIKPQVRMNFKAARKALTRLWLAVVALALGGTLWFTLATSNIYELLWSDFQAAGTPADGFNVIAQLVLTFAGVMVGLFMALGLTSLIEGHFVIKRALNEKTIKDYEPEELFQSSSHKPAKSGGVILKYYGLLFTIYIVPVVMVSFSSEMILVDRVKNMLWGILLVLFWVAYFRRAVSPRLQWKVLVMVLISLHIIALVWGMLVMLRGSSEPLSVVIYSLLNHLLALPLYGVLIWYAYRFIPGYNNNQNDFQ